MKHVEADLSGNPRKPIGIDPGCTQSAQWTSSTEGHLRVVRVIERPRVARSALTSVPTALAARKMLWASAILACSLPWSAACSRSGSAFAPVNPAPKTTGGVSPSTVALSAAPTGASDNGMNAGVAPTSASGDGANAIATPTSASGNAVNAPVPTSGSDVTHSTLPRATDPEGMLYVPGGEFTMGVDSGGEEDEHPAHRVRVGEFYLDRLEVTVEDYMTCVKAGHCRMYREDVARSFHAGDDAGFRHPKQPISGVSWDDAVAYCASVGKRLPREAEWERAASGDDKRRFVWGNELPDPTRHGCFMRAVGPKGQTTCDVGSYPAGKGPYGHLDLAGNVWEWTADDYDPYAYRRATAAEGRPGSCEQILAAQNEIRDGGRRGFTGSNPVPTTCEKVLRGGAFNYPGPGLRVTNRVHHPGGWRMLVAGFRCAKDVAAPAP